jgi:hypothetical protein
VDLKQVDWVEIADGEAHNIRVAIDRSSHLPTRSVVVGRDPATGGPTETRTTFSNYRLIDGMQTALQVSRFLNGTPVTQVFYSACRHNTNLSSELFSRASLDRQKKK